MGAGGPSRGRGRLTGPASRLGGLPMGGAKLEDCRCSAWSGQN